MNTQKHCSENLISKKFDRALWTELKKQTKQILARRRNIKKHVLIMIRENQSGLNWLGVSEVSNVAVSSPDSRMCVCC
jgi:hypothetical protein